MAACDENDPFPCKTPAELAAEETTRDEIDAFNDRTPWLRWGGIVVAILMIAGGIIRWCTAN